MVRAFRRWLADVPFDDPFERQLAPLAQLVLLGLGLVVVIALIVNVLLFGAQAFSLPILGPNAVMLAVVLSALYLLRRRHFRAVNWIIVITLLLLQAYHLATIPLYAAAYLLLIFILPIAAAGLMISRGALVSVTAASIGLVALAAINAPAVSLAGMPSPAAVVLVFILITGLFAFFIDLFRASFRHALLAALEHGATVERRQTENLTLLRETEAQRERLQVTLTSIGDAVITTDAKGNVQFVNPIAEQLTGWSQAESVGQPLETI